MAKSKNTKNSNKITGQNPFHPNKDIFTNSNFEDKLTQVNKWNSIQFCFTVMYLIKASAEVFINVSNNSQYQDKQYPFRPQCVEICFQSFENMNIQQYSSQSFHIVLAIILLIIQCKFRFIIQQQENKEEDIDKVVYIRKCSLQDKLELVQESIYEEENIEGSEDIKMPLPKSPPQHYHSGVIRKSTESPLGFTQLSDSSSYYGNETKSRRNANINNQRSAFQKFPTEVHNDVRDEQLKNEIKINIISSSPNQTILHGSFTSILDSRAQASEYTGADYQSYNLSQSLIPRTDTGFTPAGPISGLLSPFQNVKIQNNLIDNKRALSNISANTPRDKSPNNLQHSKSSPGGAFGDFSAASKLNSKIPLIQGNLTTGKSFIQQIVRVGSVLNAANSFKSMSNALQNQKTFTQSQVSGAAAQLQIHTMYKSQIKQLEKQLNNTKIFLNMVIHDMRNPTNSIEFALKEVIRMLQTCNEKQSLFNVLDSASQLSMSKKRGRTGTKFIEDSSSVTLTPQNCGRQQASSFKLWKTDQVKIKSGEQTSEYNQQSSKKILFQNNNNSSTPSETRGFTPLNQNIPDFSQYQKAPQSQNMPGNLLHEVREICEESSLDLRSRQSRHFAGVNAEANISNNLSINNGSIPSGAGKSDHPIQSNLSKFRSMKQNNQNSMVAKAEEDRDQFNFEINNEDSFNEYTMPAERPNEPNIFVPQTSTKSNFLIRISEARFDESQFENSENVQQRRQPKIRARRFIQLSDLVYSDANPEGAEQQAHTQEIPRCIGQGYGFFSTNKEELSYTQQIQTNNLASRKQPGHSNNIIPQGSINVGDLPIQDPQADYNAFIQSHERICLGTPIESSVAQQQQQVFESNKSKHVIMPAATHSRFMNEQHSIQVEDCEKVMTPTVSQVFKNAESLYHQSEEIKNDGQIAQSSLEQFRDNPQQIGYIIKHDSRFRTLDNMNNGIQPVKQLKRRGSNNSGCPSSGLQHFTLHLAQQNKQRSLFKTEKSQRYNSPQMSIANNNCGVSNVSKKSKTIKRLNPNDQMIDILAGGGIFMNIDDRKQCEQWVKNSLFSSTMLLNLINDLLDLAKIENSQFNFNTTLFNLHDVIQKALDTLDFQAQQKNITMEYEFEHENAGHFIEISGDDNRYLQILLNFLSNALKFTTQHGKIKIITKLLDSQQSANITQQQSNNRLQLPTKSILGEYGDPHRFNASRKSQNKRSKSLESLPYSGQRALSKLVSQNGTTIEANSKEPGEIGKIGKIRKLQVRKRGTNQPVEKYIKFEMRIVDSGVGISPENLDKLFMNFSKLEEHAAGNKRGTGLGLSICKSLIELMGGSVRVESELGVGTSFIMQLNTKCKLANAKKVQIWLKTFRPELCNNCAADDVNDSVSGDACRLIPAGNLLKNLSVPNQLMNQMLRSCPDQSRAQKQPMLKPKLLRLEGGTYVQRNSSTSHKSSHKTSKFQQSMSSQHSQNKDEIKQVNLGIGKSKFQKKPTSKQPEHPDLASGSFSVKQNNPEFINYSFNGKHIEISELKKENHSEVDQFQSGEDEEEEEEDYSQSDDLPRYRALVANDDMFQLSIISSILDNCGFNVHTAENGLVAVQLHNQACAQATLYDVVLLDLDMPIMNGFEACKRIRQDNGGNGTQELKQLFQVSNRDSFNFAEEGATERLCQEMLRGQIKEGGKQMLIVALSALITENVREKGIEAGFDAFIETPLTTDKIRDVIFTRLELRQQQQLLLIQQLEDDEFIDNTNIVTQHFNDVSPSHQDNQTVSAPSSTPSSQKPIQNNDRVGSFSDSLMGGTAQMHLYLHKQKLLRLLTQEQQQNQLMQIQEEQESSSQFFQGATSGVHERVMSGGGLAQSDSVNSPATSQNYNGESSGGNMQYTQFGRQKVNNQDNI